MRRAHCRVDALLYMNPITRIAAAPLHLDWPRAASPSGLRLSSRLRNRSAGGNRPTTFCHDYFHPVPGLCVLRRRPASVTPHHADRRHHWTGYEQVRDTHSSSTPLNDSTVQPTIFALSSGPGRAAIAVIRISGSQSLSVTSVPQ